MKDKLQSLIDTFFCSVDIDKFYSQNQKEKLADWLRENGVVAPPCEVGQWLWVVRKDYVSESFRVDAFDDKNFIMIMEDAEHNTSPIYMGLKIWKIPFSFFGKNVFPTKESAEQALKGGE